MKMVEWRFAEARRLGNEIDKHFRQKSPRKTRQNTVLMMTVGTHTVMIGDDNNRLELSEIFASFSGMMFALMRR